MREKRLAQWRDTVVNEPRPAQETL
jgi:hypothetical protein